MFVACRQESIVGAREARRGARSWLRFAVAPSAKVTGSMCFGCPLVVRMLQALYCVNEYVYRYMRARCPNRDRCRRIRRWIVLHRTHRMRNSPGNGNRRFAQSPQS